MVAYPGFLGPGALGLETLVVTIFFTGNTLNHPFTNILSAQKHKYIYYRLI